MVGPKGSAAAARVMGMVDLSNVARALEGPAYVAVGLGVLGFQRAQVYRRQLERAVRQAGAHVSETGSELGQEVSSRTASLRQSVNDIAEEAAQHLPEPARQLLEATVNLVAEAPTEAAALAREVLAVGRFALGAMGPPATRLVNRQANY